MSLKQEKYLLLKAVGLMFNFGTFYLINSVLSDGRLTRFFLELSVVLTMAVVSNFGLPVKYSQLVLSNSNEKDQIEANLIRVYGLFSLVSAIVLGLVFNDVFLAVLSFFFSYSNSWLLTINERLKVLGESLRGLWRYEILRNVMLLMFMFIVFVLDSRELLTVHNYLLVVLAANYFMLRKEKGWFRYVGSSSNMKLVLIGGVTIWLTNLIGFIMANDTWVIAKLSGLQSFPAYIFGQKILMIQIIAIESVIIFQSRRLYFSKTGGIQGYMKVLLPLMSVVVSFLLLHFAPIPFDMSDKFIVSALSLILTLSLVTMPSKYVAQLSGDNREVLLATLLGIIAFTVVTKLVGLLGIDEIYLLVAPFSYHIVLNLVVYVSALPRQ